MGAGEPITCAWCHLPASWIWTNNDPGLVDANTEINEHWPIEVQPETATCLRCEEMIDEGELVEMMTRGLEEWIRQLGGEPNRPGWRDDAWATQSARVAAWLAHRAERRPIAWEIHGRCSKCGATGWNAIDDDKASMYRCHACGQHHDMTGGWEW